MSTTQTNLPPPIQSFDAVAWRHKLAGLTDPDCSEIDENKSMIEHRKWSTELCVCLCEIFGDKGRGGPLERITLWDRIESALRTSVAKSGDGSIDRLMSLCVEHVHGIGYARNTRYLSLLALTDNPMSWRQSFSRYIAQHVPAILGHGARAWEQVKQENADARALDHGGILSTGEIVEKGGAK